MSDAGLPRVVRNEFVELGYKVPEFDALCRIVAGRACKLNLYKMDVYDWLHHFAELRGFVDAEGEDAVQAVLAEHFCKEYDAIAAERPPIEPLTDSIRPDAPAARLVTVRMDDVAMQPVEWLWPGRIAVGKVTALAGEGGLGKSTILFDMAARLSRGDHWPDGNGHAPLRSSVILSSEDDKGDTIKPRLAAAGADMAKVHIVEMVQNDRGGRRFFNLQADIEPLERFINDVGDVGLLIVDPVTAYLGNADSHKNADVRGVLGPLAAMTARARIATICNTHFSKAEGQKANHKFIGSVAFVNLARSAFIVSLDPNDSDRRFFIPSKSNIGRLGDGLAFRIEQCLVDDPKCADGTIVATRIAWESEPVTISADAAVAAQPGGDNDGKTRAIDFLQCELDGGARPASELLKLGREAGHSVRAIRAAREALGIQPRKATDVPHGPWMWELPDAPAADEQTRVRFT